MLYSYGIVIITTVGDQLIYTCYVLTKVQAICATQAQCALLLIAVYT